MTSQILRPLSTGELLDKTVSLYRNQFWLFVSIMSPPALMAMAMELMTSAVLPTSPIAGGVGVMIVMPLYFITYLFALAATVVAVADIFKGVPTSSRKSYAELRGRRWRILNVSAWSGLMVFLGFLVFVIPGILLAVRYSLAIPAAVLEDFRGRQALKRSRMLLKGFADRVYVIGILGIILGLVAVMLFEAPFTAVQAIFFGGQALPLWLALVASTGTFVANALSGALAIIAISLLYFDMRIRKEGYDLQAMMEAMDRSALAAAASSAGPANPSSP